MADEVVVGLRRQRAGRRLSVSTEHGRAVAGAVVCRRLVGDTRRLASKSAGGVRAADRLIAVQLHTYIIITTSHKHNTTSNYSLHGRTRVNTIQWALGVRSLQDTVHWRIKR